MLRLIKENVLSEKSEMHVFFYFLPQDILRFHSFLFAIAKHIAIMKISNTIVIVAGMNRIPGMISHLMQATIKPIVKSKNIVQDGFSSIQRIAFFTKFFIIFLFEPRLRIHNFLFLKLLC